MSITVQRKIATLLDRPGGRLLLSMAATHWARSLTGDQNLSIFYDDMWIDIVDHLHIPRSPEFSYYAFDFQQMRRIARERLAASLDYWTHVYRPQAGDIVIDVGAGIGIDTLALSPLVKNSGRMYSLEAHPWTFSALLKTCALNRLTNVTPLHLALSDQPGELWISDLPNTEENSVSKAFTEENTVSVPAATLDSFVDSQRIDHIALLKMNIEGAERMVIQGMRKCIDKIDHIAIACHDFRGDEFRTRQLIIAFLRDNKFNIIERLNDPRPYVRDHVHGVRKLA